jgi:hypothetical protein
MPRELAVLRTSVVQKSQRCRGGDALCRDASSELLRHAILSLHAIILGMRPYKRLIAILLIFVFLLPGQLCHAWSEGGHHLIAAIAFSLLTNQEQVELLAVLKQHPRFAEDFVPPEKVANDEERTRWLVGRAGYWPDVARKQPKYHRSTWHYELGPTIVLGNADGIEVPQRPGSLPLDATMETQDLYLSQAVELCRKVLSDKSQLAGDRAIALCWIGHLVADAHQPCHAGSLYMEKVFVKKDGDRGANSIPTKQRQNMHALWDQLLGDEFAQRTNRRRFAEITSSPQLSEIGRIAVSIPGGLDPLVWLGESRKAAVEHVYTDDVLQSLNILVRGLAEKPEVMTLSEYYLKNAGRVAQQRATQGAYRLAGVWRECLGRE